MAKKYDLGATELSNVQLEALVMEKLAGASRILDIYGYCGTSLKVEAMLKGISGQIIPGKGVAEQENLYKEGDFRSFNNLTSNEKLVTATAMAEALVDLHDFDDGMIVHGDVNIEQWLVDDQGRIKLNDFNLAEILPWNDESQQYCPFKRKYDGAFRLVRSPEEFMGIPTGREKDIFSYGNVIYSLLTGLWPFYDELARKEDYVKRRESIVNGARPYIDKGLNQTTNYIDRQLLGVMRDC